MYRQGEEQTPWGQVNVPFMSMDCSPDFDLSVKAARLRVDDHSFNAKQWLMQGVPQGQQQPQGPQQWQQSPMHGGQPVCSHLSQPECVLLKSGAKASAPACCACGYAVQHAVMLYALITSFLCCPLVLDKAKYSPAPCARADSPVLPTASSTAAVWARQSSGSRAALGPKWAAATAGALPAGRLHVCQQLAS